MKTIEEWIGFVLKESEHYQDLILDMNLNDASGKGDAMAKMISQGQGARPLGVLLTGPSGSGKHHTAWHLLQALDSENFAPIFLSGEALAEFEGDYAAVTARLNELFEQFYDRKQNLCLVLEDPEASGLGRQLYAFLGMTLRTYQSYPNEDPTLFLIVIANDQPPLPSMLRDMLLFCPHDLPNQERRESYLNERGKFIRNDVSLKHLAELSEGCSYAALGQLVGMLGFEIDATNRAPDEETLLNSVRSVLPARKAETAGSGIAAQVQEGNAIAAALRRLETVFADMAKKLDNLKLGTTGVETNRIITEGQGTETILDEEKERKRIENMKVSDLCAELFGEERAAALLQN